MRPPRILPLLITRHVEVEGPGLLGDILEEKGIPFTLLDVDQQTRWPDPGDFRAMVCLGGPQSVYEEDKFPELAGEVAFIQRALAARLPFLGICLGSQLLARALGARVFANRAKEIGWGRVDLSPEGARDPLLGGLAPGFTALHWHGDTFDIPPGCLALAGSSLTPNQAFRHSDFAWGLQFHLEVREKDLREWISYYPGEAGLFTPAGGDRGIPENMPACLESGRKVLEAFLKRLPV